MISAPTPTEAEVWATRIDTGHIEALDQDVLVTEYADGHRTIAYRPGRDRTEVSWGAPVDLLGVTL